VTVVITASERALLDGHAHWAESASPQRLIVALRREGADPVRKARPWSLSLEDRVLLVTAYWRTNLPVRQLAALFGSPSRPPTASSVTSDRRSPSSSASGSERTPC
jgi:hypothetical protein